MKKPIIRCSGLDKLLSCPGSRTIEALLPMDFTFEASGDEMTFRGNWIHADTAWKLVRDHGAIARDGIAAPSLPPNWKPDLWAQRTSDWYVAQVVGLTPADHAIYVEQRYTIEFERFILTGQVDCFTLSPDGKEVFINDDKTGIVEVDHAEENWQLAGYAMLLKRAIPTIETGKLRILQREAADQVTEVDLDQFAGLSDYLEGRINEALDLYLVLENGYKQCRHCTGIEICPVIDEEITAMRKILTPEQVKTIQTSPSLKELAELAYRGRAIAGPIQKILEKLKARIEVEGNVVLSDGVIASIVIEPGRRKVTDPKRAFEFLSDELQDEEKAWAALDFSLTGAEDQLVEAGMQRDSKKPEVPTAKSWIKEKLGHLIQRPDQKTLRWK